MVYGRWVSLRCLMEAYVEIRERVCSGETKDCRGRVFRAYRKCVSNEVRVRLVKLLWLH